MSIKQKLLDWLVDGVAYLTAALLAILWLLAVGLVYAIAMSPLIFLVYLVFKHLL